MNRISEIVDEYYDFIVGYEKYIDSNKNDFDNEPMDKKHRELANFIKNFYVEEYLPWRKIKGNIKEHLLDIFSSKNQEIHLYLRVADFVEDALYDLGYMDLIKYYQNQGIDVKDDNIIDKIQDEALDLIDKEVLDSQIFSENTLKLHPLARKIENACSKLWDIHKNSDKEMEK